MDEYTIDGSRFSGLMQAMDYLVNTKYAAADTILICDAERGQYTLKSKDGRELARFEY